VILFPELKSTQKRKRFQEVPEILQSVKENSNIIKKKEGKREKEIRNTRRSVTYMDQWNQCIQSRDNFEI
jgi:hypothetical protein